jgi:hypothetical protein
MAKLIKDGNVQNIITDGDVIVTSPSKIGKTLDEVLIEQQSDIDRLKSNVKYIYAYGGVGGSGSGGSGTGEKPASVLITLNGVAVNNGNSAIILDGKGKYKLYVKVSNAGGKNLFMGYTTNGSAVTDDLMFYTLNGDNKYKREVDIELNGNGKLNIAISDDEGNNIGYYTQDYIVDSDMFNVTLNYIDHNNEVKQYSSEPYECFVTDLNRRNRYFKIDYDIYLLDYTDVNITCEIDGVGTIYSGNESVEIPIEGENCGVFINGKPILQNEHMGIYTLKATLSYKIAGREVVRTRSFLFSVVPSDLYINVRTSGDVLYNNLDLLLEDIKNGEEGIPYKNISQGSSLMMYCKVFEGSVGSNPNTYVTTFTAFDRVLDDDENETWEPLNVTESETLTEQVESHKGVSITFPSGGIKKIVISTKGAKGDEAGVIKTFEKFVFVKSFESKCEWFDKVRHNNIVDSYFRANQGVDTYRLFPTLSSGNGVLSLTSSSNPIELSQSDWGEGINGNVCTVITLGIQVSDINTENAKIIDIYSKASTTEPEYQLRTTRLFEGVDSEINKIAIPTESLNKNENSQYHLVQIIRNLSDFSKGDAVYEDCLYIDGLLESVDRKTYKVPSVISKLVLNNINICYNLINIQYFDYNKIVGEDVVKFNPDGFAYQYWLSYKEKYVNSGLDIRVKESEIFIKENMDRIFFDGTNVVVDPSVVVDIAGRSDLPTVVFSYNCETGGENSISEFMELMWKGRANGDTNFNNREIDLYWIPERTSGSMSDFMVNIPNNFTDNANGYTITGKWEISLQGTSTMRNRIKNYSLRINSGDGDKILFSPNFDINNSKTFLPDLEWTIKADIADSAHANNTSIGKFVNTVCSKIDTNIPDGEKRATDFIKNTLEGIPTLLYFMCTGKGDDGEITTKVYYFGVYNFNLGRNSYYNLGYTGGIVDRQENRSDFMRVFYNMEDGISSKYYKDRIFSFAVGEGMLSPNIAVGEIQDNYPEFDFHQYDETLLFKRTKNDNACMFGDDSKITASNVAEAQKSLTALVKGVAKAGKFCFEKVGRKNDFVTSRYFAEDENGDPIYGSDGDLIYGNNSVNRYDRGQIPDPKWQKSYTDTIYEDGSNIFWYQSDMCDNVTIEDLKNLVTKYDIDGYPNKPILNFTSASEYYTICMAFGMVDSVLKNMNLKNFKSESDGYEFYCAFYDMDCALEEANDGQEKISYLAATDYWYSEVLDEKTNKIGQIQKKNDYWNTAAGNGFDFTSSYLFAVVKYAKPIFESYPAGVDKYEGDLYHYPQHFWAALRNANGELRSADYFIENYFKSGISSTFEYLASLNYRVKYLYHGETFDSNNNPIDRYLANCEAFNGSRKIKVKNWLLKRLRFMDLMMNVNNLSIPIYSGTGLFVPGPGNEFKDTLSSNYDITILHSAFDSSEKNAALTGLSGDVKIYAPKHTPFIFTSGSTGGLVEMYLLPGGVDKPNVIPITTFKDVGCRFYGSGMFTSVDKIEYMFTGYRSIISDNIEKITYGGSNVSVNSGEFQINAKSVTEINMNIPNMGGTLMIDENCISLMKINIAGSGFGGRFQGFPNLQEVNISGVNSSEIYVSGSNFLTGERFYISGGENKKTSITTLNISDVTGNFNCDHTNIEQISITNSTDRDDSDFNSDMLSEFSISGDKRLKKLTLNGFRKVSITQCNNLEELSIDDALEELYINLEKVDKDEVTSSLKKISYGTSVADGVFDFTNYPNLKRVTLKNCDNLEWVKLPDQDIETDGMSNNPKLKWIDTGSKPAFVDIDYDHVKDGYIYGVGDYANEKYPIYPQGSKLILCKEGVFQNCPNYNMIRSDWNSAQNILGDNYIYTIAYTNITISESCTSLAKTFSISGTSSNTDGGCPFNMDTVMRFIKVCIPDTIKRNITSLSECFRGRSDISYTMSEAAGDYYNGNMYCPDLKEFTSLRNISRMYENTGVTFISKQLLSLPYVTNDMNNPLSWSYFISRMNLGVNISKDALMNISYRLDSYSNIKFNIYEYDENSSQYKLAGNSTNKFNICEFFHYKTNDGEIIPYSNITSIDSLNFADQYIDLSGMFNLFPNVNNISNFLNGSLRKYNMDGLLMPCKNILSIYNSFCDDDINNNIENPQIIDLYNFFNWENNTSVGVISLFEGQTGNNFTNGFKVRKTITYADFKKVLKKIEDIAVKNVDFKRLTNIFSYCKITGYKGEEIKFEKSLDNIKNISFLFENCTSDYTPLLGAGQGEKGIYTGGVLNIGRSFFEKLPEFNIAQRTFANTYLSSSLTYDYFCKREPERDENDSGMDILLSEDQNDVAKLYERGYSSNIINLKECFYNTKFVNCKNWFDHNDDINVGIIGKRNYISYGDVDKIKIDVRGQVYYKYNVASGLYERYILDNDVFDDCLDNYTDFIPYNAISTYKWYNHDLQQDFWYYGNIKGGIQPFDPKNESCNNTIQKTYCCLPPDFLYGCSSSAIIDGIFANSNIIGVIPRNLTKKIKNQSIPDIFRNVNIMPNIEYYYDVKGSLNSILNEIADNIEIDGEVISNEYCVVFRDENGILKKRKPVVSDKNLGQFVYIPDNFTTNGSLMNTFNFRYNLPKHWNMPFKETNIDGYKTTSEFDSANLTLDYHTQYYFTTDKSVKWEILRDVKSVFITNEQDIDFSNKVAMGQSRNYCDKNGEIDQKFKNTWLSMEQNSIDISIATNWFNSGNIFDKFYIDLNLCGKKNIYNMIEDYGCPIVVKNREVYLDNFVSGILTVFLNGRVFYDGFSIHDLSSVNHKDGGGTYVVGYYGLGKNIILPKYNGILADEKFTFIPTNGSNIIYCDFMINNNDSQSITNYTDTFGKININTDKNKYTFRPQ